MLSYFLLLFFFSLASCGIWPGHIQSVGVIGRLFCNGRPASGVLVKLKDWDLFDPDDKMDQSVSLLNGDFLLSGWTKEWTKIDPYFAVYHKCNYNGWCVRKLKMDIPTSFVSHGVTTPARLFDVGPIELSRTWDKESYDCFH